MARSAEVYLLCSIAIITVFVAQHTTASGYDSSGSCNPRPSRRGRAQLLATIPCDLTVQAYCNLPGTAYPWNAVRRFVHENQGLMKRMYGDTRHISVLKSEIEKNEIDVDDIQIAADRYSSPGKRREERKTKYSNAGHTGRLNDVLTEPHFRPASTTTTTTAKSTTTSTENPATDKEAPVDTTEASQSSPFDQRTSTMSYTEEVENLKNKYDILREEDEEKEQKATRDESLETNSLLENSTENSRTPEPISSYNQEKIPEGLHTSTEKVDAKERQPISSTLKIVKIDSQPENTTLKSSESDEVEPVDSFGDMIIVENESGGGYRETSDIPPSRSQIRLKPTTERGSIATSTTTTTTSSSTTKSDSNRSPLDRVDEFSDESSEIYADTKFGQEKHTTGIVQPVPQQTQSVQPTMEGHLYQDSLHKNNAPVVTGRGVNACPVKEEVVAPFWANNTRGEVLALLNLYPFEQYVHWEKCTHENKQMYCREGCRCEQQYRLHRLLAYDPHNECRGIFSDWFRFPSCCICKCYDLAHELRVTSRSPRSPREAPAMPDNSFSTIEEAERHLHEAVYSHTTKDWYRVKRDAQDMDMEDQWTDDFGEEEDAFAEDMFN